MSAIFGIVELDGQPISSDYLQLMQNKLRHYGRDEQQYKTYGSAGFGCCLDKYGIQSKNDSPILDITASGTILTCDAQIYNKKELATGCGFTNDGILSNQQILIAAYEKWGNDFTKHVNGDYTCAIYDAEQQRLFLVRDHLGIRPLYYYVSAKHFCFATDYRALLALPFVGRKIDEVQMYSKIGNVYHINPEATPFEQIRSLPAAHTLSLNGGIMSKRKYWKPGDCGLTLCEDEQEYCQQLYELVNDSVTRRVNYFGGGIGAELSGGLDSAVVAILAARETKKSGFVPVMFSWTPSRQLAPETDGDERRLIEAICKQEGFSCIYNNGCFSLNVDKAAPLLPPLAWDGNSVFPYELQQLSERGVRLIFSGHGGDEGASHRASLWELLRNGFTGAFLREIAGLSGWSPLRFAKLLAANTVMRAFRPFSHFGDPNKGLADISNNGFAARMKQHCKRSVMQFSSKPEAYIESGVLQLRTEVTAWIGADFGTRHLFPLLDFRILDYALSIPRHWHYKNGYNRYLYRKTFAELLPPSFNSYFTKDDPAKTATLRNNTGRDIQKLRAIASQLDFSIFGDYIDKNRLESALSSEADIRNVHILTRKLSYCRNIQRLLTDLQE